MVLELQELLCAHGFRLKVDGNYGYLTENAVKTFQRRHQLRVDGIIGSKTWAVLKSTVKPGTRILKRGDTGIDVSELQGLLKVNGYNIERNGIFDAETQQAVMDFQLCHRLNSNGMVTPITWTVLCGKTPTSQL
jgi:peptidoglycan hydrolase-like protein with peptidoglycan-binding domain